LFFSCALSVKEEKKKNAIAVISKFVFIVFTKLCCF